MENKNIHKKYINKEKFIGSDELRFIIYFTKLLYKVR